MRDYWLSKLFFDLQQPATAEEYLANRDRVLARYPLKPEAKCALASDDVVALANWINPYLLRFYFLTIGKSEAWFLERISKTAPGKAKEPLHG